MLEEMEMLHAFTAVLHVPNLSKLEHLLSVLEESEVFSKQEVAAIARNIGGSRYVTKLFTEHLPGDILLGGPSFGSFPKLGPPNKSFAELNLKKIPLMPAEC